MKKNSKPRKLFMSGTGIVIAKIEPNGNLFVDSLIGRSEYDLEQFERLHKWLGKALKWKQGVNNEP